MNRAVKYKFIFQILGFMIIFNSILIAAEKNSYLGIAFASEKSSSYFHEEDALAGILLKSGYDFHKNTGIEFRISTTLQSEEKIKHDYSIGLYFKPKAQLMQNFTVYGLLGYGKHRISFPKEETANGITDNQTSVSAFSYGVGMEYRIANEWSLFLETMQVVDESKEQLEGKYAIEVQGIYFGINYRFNKDESIIP